VQPKLDYFHVVSVLYYFTAQPGDTLHNIYCECGIIDDVSVVENTVQSIGGALRHVIQLNGTQ